MSPARLAARNRAFSVLRETYEPTPLALISRRVVRDASVPQELIALGEKPIQRSPFGSGGRQRTRRFGNGPPVRGS